VIEQLGHQIDHTPCVYLNGATESAFADFLHFCNISFMKATLSISGRGLIALPAKMREAAGLRPLDNLIAETTPEGILLRPAVTVPIEIYSDERIAEFDEAEAELAVWFQKHPTLASP
jgi:bifunctional DNA-binding transcriptional regulator/antitoxin component of YhaV-PrlF toxin-antitoxin module